jgi:hypothetical protein
VMRIFCWKRPSLLPMLCRFSIIFLPARAEKSFV